MDDFGNTLYFRSNFGNCSLQVFQVKPLEGGLNTISSSIFLAHRVSIVRAHVLHKWEGTLSLRFFFSI